MQTRTLGRSGPTVSALGLGCMGTSEFYGTRDDAESLATIHRALELGCTFLDTADAYGPHANEELVALQSEYSLWSRDPEDGILAACRELGVGFVPYSPLGRGFLSGEIKRFEDLPQDDYRRIQPRFQGENFARNLELVARVREMASDKGCTPSQLALAWVLAQGDDLVPIPGTERRKYLEENVAVLDVKLDPQDLARIDEIAPRGVAAGQRYPEAMMQFVNR